MDTNNHRIPFAIAVGQTTSDAHSMPGIPRRVFIPQGFEGTSLSFEASFDLQNWFPVSDQYGALITVPVSGGAANSVALPISSMEGITSLRVKAGTAQTAARTLNVIWRRYA